MPKCDYSENIPIRVTADVDPGRETGTLKGEVVVGRGLWLFSIQHLLTKTAHVLHQHKWSILRPPEGLSWFTSDDPVIRLNYNPGGYTFKGGWGSPGTEIYLPISPSHTLYTQVGRQPPRRGEIVQRTQADIIRRVIAEHAHRMILAPSRDASIPLLRPRIVSEPMFRDEAEHWRSWNDQQMAAELKLNGSPAT